jgi:S1-C subfamily serine protease
VLTIGYLITEAEEVWLTTQDGRVVAAHALGYDQETGFGLLQALGPRASGAGIRRCDEGRTRPSSVLADGIGEFVDAKIVAKQEFAGYWEYLLDEAIFTTPAHPSWGGAALVDEDGKLLGIGSLRLQMSQGGETADINMIVPINLLPPILDDLMTRGQVNKPPRPWLGAFLRRKQRRRDRDERCGRKPGRRGGAASGDVISEIRDGEVDGLADFYRKIWSSGPAGAEIPIRILRDGREAWLRVRSADRNSFLRKPQLQ